MTKKLPYTEHHGLMDGRLVICGLAVGIAMFALAWDLFYPFPKVRKRRKKTRFLPWPQKGMEAGPVYANFGKKGWCPLQ